MLSTSHLNPLNVSLRQVDDSLIIDGIPPLGDVAVLSASKYNPVRSLQSMRQFVNLVLGQEYIGSNVRNSKVQVEDAVYIEQVSLTEMTGLNLAGSIDRPGVTDRKRRHITRHLLKIRIIQPNIRT